MILMYGISIVLKIIIAVAVYAFTAYSLYIIARRNGVRFPYIAFISFAQYYVIGSICEEYVLWGYRIKHLGLVMCLLIFMQCATDFLSMFYLLNGGAAFLINIALNLLIALIMHKFYYLFSPQYAILFAIASLIGGDIAIAVILFFIKDKPMLMSAAAYRYPFGERR